MPSPDIYRSPLQRLPILSPRTLNALKRANINRVGEVVGMSDHQLLALFNSSDKCLDEKLSELGLTRGAIE